LGGPDSPGAELVARGGIVAERGVVDELLSGLTTRPDLDVVGPVVDVGRDADVIPNPRIVRISDVARVTPAVADVDQPVSRETNRDGSLVEAVDTLGPDRHEAVEIGCRGTRFEVETQGVGGGLGRVAATPAVASGHIGARARARQGSGLTGIGRR
jgi:hypothetical protein